MPVADAELEKIDEAEAGLTEVADFGSNPDALRMLVHLPVDALPDDSIPSELLALLETDGGRELVRTIEAYLDRAGDARATAEALHVHRTSLYYRLTRFQTLSGLDLGNGNDRLAVHLALKLLRLDDRL